MAAQPSLDILVIGCGRVGAELAMALFRRGVNVTVVDPQPKAFERLDPDFKGRTVAGSGYDRDVLRRAGIESATGVAAVTSSDNTNFIAARVARDVFHVPHVVARVYNPHHALMYERMGLQTVASSSWGAQRIEHLLTHPGLVSLSTVGNGEVTIVEVRVPQAWAGRTIRDVTLAQQAEPVALVRGGVASIPASESTLAADDLLVFSALTDAIPQLAAQVSEE